MTAPEPLVERLAVTLKAHLPKDRYDDDGHPVGTYCIGCDWTGNYFADGEAGPFDDHVARALLPVVKQEIAAGQCELQRTGDGTHRPLIRQAKAEALREALAGVRPHNAPVTPENLRWAATHEALCRFYIFDVLTGLAAALEADQ